MEVKCPDCKKIIQGSEDFPIRGKVDGKEQPYSTCYNCSVRWAAKELGKRGGEATKAKLGKEHFKRISKLGVEARNEKKV